ncbi:MAG: hypothetical protein Q7K45_07095 [Nanoarchaeota archaeon]|nr:hypothetical protein [Nanoarchaeota archaeon]
MFIPAGIVLHYKTHHSLEILAREPWLRTPLGISVVQGTYLPHRHQEKHLQHFQSGQDALRWMKDQGLTISEKVFTKDSLFHLYEVPAMADGLVELITESNKIGARKAFIRNVDSSYTPAHNQQHADQQGYATIHAALYR